MNWRDLWDWLFLPAMPSNPQDEMEAFRELTQEEMERIHGP